MKGPVHSVLLGWGAILLGVQGCFRCLAQGLVLLHKAEGGFAVTRAAKQVPLWLPWSVNVLLPAVRSTICLGSASGWQR